MRRKRKSASFCAGLKCEIMIRNMDLYIGSDEGVIDDEADRGAN